MLSIFWDLCYTQKVDFLNALSQYWKICREPKRNQVKILITELRRIFRKNPSEIIFILGPVLKLRDVMLKRKSIDYQEIVSLCETDKFKKLEDVIETQVQKISSTNEIGLFDVKVQLRLLLPITEIPPWKELSDNDKATFLIKKLEETIKSYRRMSIEYCSLAGAPLLIGAERMHHDKVDNKTYCYLKNGKNQFFLMDHVSVSDSKYIESKLHYLHSFRTDSTIRLGLYLVGYKKPVAYMSLAKVDRKDKIDYLTQFVNNQIQDDVYEIARTYGCEKLPSNTISIMMSFCFKLLRKKGVKYLITAVNPYLGFSGTSLLASSFEPFALRKVIYSYTDEFDFIVSRTKRKGQTYYTNEFMPPNILFVKQLKGKSQATQQIANGEL